MTFKFNRDALFNALNVVNSAVEKKTTIPALAFVLLEGLGDNVKITGTDIDCAIELTIQGQGNDSFCVPATQLRDVVKLASGEVEIQRDKQAVITGEGFTTKLPLMEKASFPECPKPQGLGIRISGSLFAEMLKRVSLAAETDEKVSGRWLTQTIAVQLKDGTLRLSATDTNQLATASIPASYSGEKEFLVPRRSTGALRTFASEQGEVELAAIADTHFGLIVDSGTFTTRLSVGQFPNFDLAIPKEWPHAIKFSRDEILTTLKHASLALDRNIGTRWEISKQRLLIRAKSPEIGDSQRELAIQCQSLNGDTQVLGVNGPQVLTYLAAQAGEIEFAFVDAARPFRFTTPVDGFDYQYFTMAMQPHSF